MTKPTVYLLDDEPDVLAMLIDVVHAVGLTPMGFTQASSFFEQVSQFEPTAIMVLDLNMPEMDGIEVMRRLATQDNAPALILISGLDTGVLHSAEKLGRAHNLNVIASQRKPIALSLLKLLLEQHTASFRKRPSVKDLLNEHDFTLAELKQAIHAEQLTLQYQPQYDIATRRLVGVEALVRWQHPSQGLIYPDRFIAIAEQGGLIGDLTHWVIRQAGQQDQLWQKAGFQVAISVNISAADIISLTLPEQLTELLANEELNSTRFTLEVTESALMGELVTSLDILTRLRLKGIELSIDDFGTGYSSLSQLHRIPFNELKIDRSFVANMIADEEARAIVKTCIMLGHELNMRVVAEGVETREQLDLLELMGCDIAQGFLFSKPVSAAEISAQLMSVA